MASYNVELRKRTGTTYGDTILLRTDWALINNKPTSYTPAVHTHDIDDITDLKTYTETLSIASNNSYTVTHNLGTENIIVSIFDNLNNEVYTDVVIVNSNSITISVDEIGTITSIDIIIMAVV